MTAGTKTAYYHYDGLGSVVNLTSSAGATWWTYAYLPFGGVRTATKNSNQAIDNVLRFTGGYLDPTGYYHLGARQYDSGTGRFLSTDPLKPAIADPYVAAYVYANDSPVRYTDPSGRCFGPLVFLAPACIGAAIGVVSYIVSTVGANVIGDLVNRQDPLADPGQGLNPVDALLSGAAGALTGPFGGLTFGPTRVAAGAAVGCASTFASQAAGGRTGDPRETLIGCVAGGAGSVLQLSSKVSSAFYGTIISLAQALGTTAEQRAGNLSINGSQGIAK
jgi:RHS repeat-associated protein